MDALRWLTTARCRPYRVAWRDSGRHGSAGLMNRSILRSVLIMSKVAQRVSLLLSLCVLFVLSIALGPIQAYAACGAVSCFVTIGSQQQVPQEGLLTTNFIYSYTPMTLPSGHTGIIAEADQRTQRIIPGHHRELSTITNSYTLDANYGITDR